LRGGSWNNNIDNARLSDRNNNHPDNEWNNNGFRVLASHGFVVASSMSRCRFAANRIAWRRGETGGSASWSRLKNGPAKHKKALPVPVTEALHDRNSAAVPAGRNFLGGEFLC